MKKPLHYSSYYGFSGSSSYEKPENPSILLIVQRSQGLVSFLRIMTDRLKRSILLLPAAPEPLLESRGLSWLGAFPCNCLSALGEVA
ncbi:hypothetical protein Sfum_3015 [Syntrophobacter fumaroxidans MPOB]|uniref:Uncharacterized protein n=1 Tax=Syntrophobacter fumaroxidans (strain DSM 10017 / MPOB) TaxID=335543 RepID=A0LMJ5_SYNFM|nr:hypothetical protein Sfum_2973 [Syntrophobacter fumaroxidans MPOB]ABK18689.1 hypothetical protein Sfum_3015 [Syntrophobacter fumaroxidans MPOB]